MNNSDPAPAPGDFGRDLAADLALCDAATPGPWRADPPWGLPWEVGGNLRCHDSCVTVARTLGNSTPCNLPQLDSEQAARDAAFIAAAREGWPAALRRLAALELVCALNNGAIPAEDPPA